MHIKIDVGLSIHQLGSPKTALTREWCNPWFYLRGAFMKSRITIAILFASKGGTALPIW